MYCLIVFGGFTSEGKGWTMLILSEGHEEVSVLYLSLVSESLLTIFSVSWLIDDVPLQSLPSFFTWNSLYVCTHMCVCVYLSK